MNFTREPIIETIITPKEGSKLLIRNSNGKAHDDYYVDAIEIVTFGKSFFFRSLERPKSFLVPVSDYEVIEVKETRLALKSATVERSIKIGGGRASLRSAREEKEEKRAAGEETAETRLEKKKERRRPRRRRGTEEKKGEERSPEPKIAEEEKGRASRLLPPPPTLIAQTITKYKEAIHPEGQPSEEETKKEPKKKNARKKEEEAAQPTLGGSPLEKEPEESKKPESEGKTSSFWGLFS